MKKKFDIFSREENLRKIGKMYKIFQKSTKIFFTDQYFFQNFLNIFYFSLKTSISMFSQDQNFQGIIFTFWNVISNGNNFLFSLPSDLKMVWLNSPWPAASNDITFCNVVIFFWIMIISWWFILLSNYHDISWRKKTRPKSYPNNPVCDYRSTAHSS